MKFRELRIVIGVEREGMAGLKPPVVTATSFAAAPDIDHSGILVITTIFQIR
jgi:hypothetical protein